MRECIAAYSIDQVTMFDSHTLQVDVSTQFSQDASTPKSITVSTTINGVPLQSIYPLASATGTQKKSLFIDFDGVVKVPRFTDNQVFDVTATVTESGAVVGTATKAGAEIPLPVVHVHGISADCLGDPFASVADLFAHLQSQHPSYQPDPGTRRFTATPFTQHYPTLVSFPYSSLKKSANSVATDLGAWITDFLPLTWASKVNIVAHSLGGIIAREAVWGRGVSDAVNKIVLVGSPSEGASVAPYAYNR